MYKQPDQDIYDKFYQICLDHGYNQADRGELEYPFVAFGVTNFVPNPSKTQLLGRVSMTFRVYGDYMMRKETSDIAANILRDLSVIDSKSGYKIQILYRDTSVAMRHGVQKNSRQWIADVTTQFRILN